MELEGRGLKEMILFLRRKLLFLTSSGLGSRSDHITCRVFKKQMHFIKNNSHSGKSYEYWGSAESVLWDWKMYCVASRLGQG